MQTQFTSLCQFVANVIARAEYRPRRRWQETTGQDLVEYALMAGFVAIASVHDFSLPLQQALLHR